jgi:putative transposase
VAFSLLYLGMCRILGLVVSGRRGESDKDVEIMVLRHQIRILERQLHARVRYRPADRAILAALSLCVPKSSSGLLNCDDAPQAVMQSHHGATWLNRCYL